MPGLRTPCRLKTFQTPSHARSPKQEKCLAHRLGGERVRGSGCGTEKGDVRIKGVARVETKTTGAQSFSVTREMLDKIETAALSSGEVPAFVVEFNNDGVPAGEFAVVPMWVLEMVVEGVE